MAHEFVVHCKRAAHDVYVGRPSKWGNPLVIGRDGTRDNVIARYEAWLLEQPELVAALPQLTGKTLGCWCAPRACHGDVCSHGSPTRRRNSEAPLRAAPRPTAARMRVPAGGSRQPFNPSRKQPLLRSRPLCPAAPWILRGGHTGGGTTRSECPRG